MKLFNFIIIVVWICLTIVTIGCKKYWLDARPSQDLAIPTTLQDCQALMDNSDELNKSYPGFGEVASDGHYVLDATFQSLPAYEKNAYTWSHTTLYTNILDWTNTYRKVFICNNVLEALSKINPSDDAGQAQWNNVKGQALFIRAKAFYDAAQVFISPYNSLTSNTDLGLPLRLESDINLPSVRSTIEQTYSRIINDLLESKELLPQIAAYKTRGSYPAALALLARIYLSIDDYDKAFIHANECLQLKNTLLDYNLIDSTISFPLILFNNEVIFHSSVSLNSSTNFINSIIDPALYSSYQSNDLRQRRFFKVNATGPHFYGNYTGGALLFNGLATDEIYLIRAECFARKNEVAAAMQDLNTLLAKRWKTGTFVPFIATNADDALLQILNERKKELIFRGLRWPDLKRLNKDSRFAIPITRTINGTNYTLQPNSYNYTFPIPDDIIEKTGMQQNFGW